MASVGPEGSGQVKSARQPKLRTGADAQSTDRATLWWVLALFYQDELAVLISGGSNSQVSVRCLWQVSQWLE